VQVTSQITDAQQFTINFTNNNLLGSGNFIPTYKTSKARICVTVGMMTTGYDCTDILNIGLFRPIFSPTDFIQIKGRGTRKHDFREVLFDDTIKEGVQQKLLPSTARPKSCPDGGDQRAVAVGGLRASRRRHPGVDGSSRSRTKA
jgi:superfamily II DNA or RNA helicase